MRACRREALRALDLQDRRFGYPLEMVTKAAAAGWRVVEVDVDYLPAHRPLEGHRHAARHAARGARHVAGAA